MVLDPWNIVADTDILESFLENVNVVLNCRSEKDIDDNKRRVSRGEVAPRSYTEFQA